MGNTNSNVVLSAIRNRFAMRLQYTCQISFKKRPIINTFSILFHWDCRICILIDWVVRWCRVSVPSTHAQEVYCCCLRQGAGDYRVNDGYSPYRTCRYGV